MIEISVASLHTFSDVSHVISTGDFNARTGPYQTMDSDQFACFVTLTTCRVNDPFPNVLTYSRRVIPRQEKAEEDQGSLLINPLSPIDIYRRHLDPVGLLVSPKRDQKGFRGPRDDFEGRTQKFGKILARIPH